MQTKDKLSEVYFFSYSFRLHWLISSRRVDFRFVEKGRERTLARVCVCVCDEAHGETTQMRIRVQTNVAGKTNMSTRHTRTKPKQTKESIGVTVDVCRKGRIRTWKIFSGCISVRQQIPTVCQCQVIYGLIVSFAYVILLQFIRRLYLLAWKTFPMGMGVSGANCRNCWLQHHFMNYYCYYLRYVSCILAETRCDTSRPTLPLFYSNVWQGESGLTEPAAVHYASARTRARRWCELVNLFLLAKVAKLNCGKSQSVKHVQCVQSLVCSHFYDLSHAKWSLWTNRISHRHV